jgi:hypothetical protein
MVVGEGAKGKGPYPLSLHSLFASNEVFMDSVDWVNQQSLALWKKTFNAQEDVLLPLIYPPIKKSALLFIGLNPSFNPKALNSNLRGTPYAEINVKDFCHYSHIGNYDLKSAKNIVQLTIDKYPYFNRFKEIARSVGKDWEHIDLYFYYETSQSTIRQKIKYNNPKDFWGNQLVLSKKLISEAKPIMIVGANAYASTIFEKEFNAKYNKEKGYHEIQLNGKTLPVFLGGMLTGQRALDNYSFERLKWHIRQTIKGIKDES